MSKMITKTIELIANVDGASSGNPGDASIGVVIQDKRHIYQETISQYIGQATNNVAEYRALLMALKRAKDLGGEKFSVKSDSELLVKQIKGVYKVKNDALKELNSQAQAFIKNFKFFSIEHVRREYNKEADKLAKQAITEYRRASRMVAAQDQIV